MMEEVRDRGGRALWLETKKLWGYDGPRPSRFNQGRP